MIGTYRPSGVVAAHTTVAQLPVTASPAVLATSPLALLTSPRLSTVLASVAPSRRTVVVAAPHESDVTPKMPRHRLSSVLLARLIAACSADVDARTQSALVNVESGGDAWAVHDDNDDSHYSPDSRDDAVRIFELLAARDQAIYGANDRGIDVGLAQINSKTFEAVGGDASAMLDPCRNLRASDVILTAAYRTQRQLVGQPPGAGTDQLALERALQVYNSGQNSGDERYVSAIRSSVEQSATAREDLAAPVVTTTMKIMSPRPPSAPARERSAEFVHVDLFSASRSSASPASRPSGATPSSSPTIAPNDPPTS